MKKKIYYALSIILLIGIGATTYILTKPKNKQETVKDFIVVTADGDSSYPFEMTFPLGTHGDEIARAMHMNGGEQMYKKVGREWSPIEMTEGIYEDVHLKIS